VEAREAGHAEERAAGVCEPGGRVCERQRQDGHATLAGVAGLYFLLNAEFLAAVQLVVYVGGTLILIIFGVMLTSTSPFSRFEPKRIEVIISLTLGLLIVFSLTLAIGRSRLAATETTAGSPTLISIGQSLLGDYLLPFELSSVVLLVVLIGAAYLARAGKKPTHEQSAELSEQAKKMS